MRRREFIAAASASSTGIIAGCSSDESGDTGNNDETDSSDNSSNQISLQADRNEAGAIILTVEGMNTTDVTVSAEEATIPEVRDEETIVFPAAPFLSRGDQEIEITRNSDEAVLFDGTVFFPGPVLEVSDAEILNVSATFIEEANPEVEYGVTLQNTGETPLAFGRAGLGSFAYEDGGVPLDLDPSAEPVEEILLGDRTRNVVLIEPDDEFRLEATESVDIEEAGPVEMSFGDARGLTAAQTSAEVSPGAEIIDSSFSVSESFDIKTVDTLTFTIDNTGNVSFGGNVVSEGNRLQVTINGAEVDVLGGSDNTPVPGETTQVEVIQSGDNLTEGENVARLEIIAFGETIASTETTATL